MKKLLLLLFAVSFIAFGQDQNIIDYNDTIIMDELRVMKSDSSLVNGKVKSLHENGQLYSEVIFKNGKPDGVWEVYNEEGKLKAKVFYRFGIKVKIENFN